MDGAVQVCGMLHHSAKPGARGTQQLGQHKQQQPRVIIKNKCFATTCWVQKLLGQILTVCAYAGTLAVSSAASIICLYCDFCLTPGTFCTRSLSLNSCMVGVPLTPAASAISGSCSMSIST